MDKFGLIDRWPYPNRSNQYTPQQPHQGKKLVELEAEVRALTAKAHHAHEEEKGKWAELAREKAAAATGARRVSELEAQVASLNDMVELLSLDKEQLLLDKELLVRYSRVGGYDNQTVCVLRSERLASKASIHATPYPQEERAEELSLELETAKLELEHAVTSSPAPSLSGEGGNDAAALAEQNTKLRAALKRLQELSSHEKAELLRRQRELEREAAQVRERESSVVG